MEFSVTVPVVRNVLERFDDIEPPYFDRETVAELVGMPLSRVDDLESKPEIITRGDCLFLMADPVMAVAHMQGRWVLLTSQASRRVYDIEPNRQGIVFSDLKIPDFVRVFKTKAEAMNFLGQCDEASVPTKASIESRADLLIASGARRILVGMGLNQYVYSQTVDLIEDDGPA